MSRTGKAECRTALEAHYRPLMYFLLRKLLSKFRQTCRNASVDEFIAYVSDNAAQDALIGVCADYHGLTCAFGELVSHTLLVGFVQRDSRGHVSDHDAFLLVVHLPEHLDDAREK